MSDKTVVVQVPSATVASVAQQGPPGPGSPLGTAVPIVDGIAAAGVAVSGAHEDHVHPTDTSRLVASAVSAFGLTLVDDADAATARTTLGLGTAATHATTDYDAAGTAAAVQAASQPVNANLTALAGLTGAADKIGYFTGLGTMTLADLTGFGRSLLAAVDASVCRTVLGLGGAALLSVGAVAGTVCAGDDARLSDARTPVAHTQAASTISDSTAAGRGLLTALDAGAQRTLLGLGTAATTDATAYDAAGSVSTHAALTTGVHGLAITAGQTLTVMTGGTLGTAAYTAVTAYQASSSLLSAFAGLGSGLVQVTGASTATVLALGTADQVAGVNHAGAAMEYKSILGTSNQVTVTHAANSITLSLPQDIHTAATPAFAAMAIGTITTRATELQVASTSTSSPRGIMSSQHNGGTDGARFHMRKSRGTNASPTVITTGDMLGRLVASGYDGANYLEMGAIQISSTGTIASTRVPTQMSFWTATDAAPSVLTEALRITSAQQVSILATTASTTTATGALVVGGGLGVAGAAYVGGALTVTTNGNAMLTISSTATSDNTASFSLVRSTTGSARSWSFGVGGLSTGDFTIVDVTAPATRLKILTTGEIVAYATIASTSPTTGALLVPNGGVGIAGALFIGGATSHGGDVTFVDAKNVILNATTGTKIATATTQKLGFWNATPVVQPASASQAAITGTAGATYTAAEQTMLANLKTLVNQIRADLVTVGILKGAA